MASSSATVKFLFISIGAIALAMIILLATGEKPIQLLNVSYDPTRELYSEINRLFEKNWREKTGQSLLVRQSHGGSGKQARSVIDGLNADIVTLALAYDIDEIANRTHKIPADWQKKLPHNSAPFTSTVVFLIRKGNPKDIRDWSDLIKNGVSVITPNPKTSGGARWNYLAAWAYADERFNGDQTKIMNFMRKLFLNVPVLDTGARGSTTSFVQRKIGDVLIAWENEALLATKLFPEVEFEIVVPSISILAEPPVTVVEANAEANGTLKAAQEYLNFLYTPEGQRIAARHYFRPTDEKIMEEFEGQFPKIHMVTIDDDFHGWKDAQEKHFSDGGMFDQIYLNRNGQEK